MADEFRLLYIDDEPEFGDILAKRLEQENDRFSVESISDPRRALDRILTGSYDCILCDYKMPSIDGMELLKRVRDADPEIPFVMITARGTELVASEAFSADADDYRLKERVVEDFGGLAGRIEAIINRHRSQRSYRDIFEKSPDGVTLHDPDTWEILEVNQRFCDMVGYSRDELLELDLRDLYPGENPYTAKRMREYMQKAATEGPQQFEWVERTKEKETLPVEVNLTQVTIAGNERILATMRDISERKRQERELKRYRRLVETVGDPIYALGQDGTVEMVNRACCDVLGKEADEIIGSHVSEFVSEADVDRGTQAIDRVISADAEPMERLEIRLLDATGRERFFETKFAVLTEGDEFTGTVGVLRDVTERRDRELELEVTTRRLEAILDNTTTPMFMKDDEGRYLFVNRGYRDLFGISDEDIEGKTAFDLHPPEMANVATINDQRVLEEGEAIETEERIPVGTDQRFFLTTKVPIYDTGERSDPETPVAVFGVASDITALKRREVELQRERDLLDEFASVVSHDLRNPLNVATGRLELARETSDNEHLAAVARALERMEVLIGDMLKLAREGRDVSDFERIELAELLIDCWKNVETVDATLRVETDMTIRADRSRIHQLFENLFRNAIEHGGTDVTVTVGEFPGGLYVEDTGPGIPEDIRQTIFKPGCTGDNDGTGFGLAIVRKIADAHEWTIRVSNGTDGGARFEITGVEKLE